MPTQFIKKSIIVFLIGLFLLPNISFALNPEELIKKEDLIELKGSKSVDILESIKQKLYDDWEELPSPEEQTILITIRKSITAKTLKHIFVDMGGDLIKSTLDLSYFLLSLDPSFALKKIEKFTVNKAKEYALDWFLQNEIKISKGNFNYGYKALDGSGYVIGKIPYIIVYSPINKNRGEVVIGIYSAKTIKTPQITLNHQWEGGVYELPPYKVIIKGEVRENKGRYIWLKGPEIDIIFDEPVPSFEFREETFASKVESSLKNLKSYSNKISEKINNFVNIIKEGIKEAKSFISQFSFLKASISSNVSQLDYANILLDYNQQEIKQKIVLTELAIEKEKSSNVKQLDIIEMLDDIAEKIDILNQEIKSLVSTTNSFIAKTVVNELGSLDEEQEHQEQESEDFVIKEESNMPDEDDLITVISVASSESVNTSIHRRSGISYCSISSVGSPSQSSIIFNEIAWMGTGASSNDEWIELYNRSGQDIDLEGWQVIDHANQIQISFEIGNNIEGKGFYLLERTDETTIEHIKADFIYTGTLSNNNESIYLFNANCNLEDLAQANPDWPAGDKGEKRTMERDANLSWYSYSGDKENNIYGTPRSQNSEPVISVEEPEAEEVIENDPPIAEDDKIEEEDLPSSEEPDSLDGEEDDQDLVGSVIFNEIAWMGTEVSSSDEWIELYNTTEEQIDLVNWQFIFTSPSGTSKITTFKVIETTTPIINGLSYFLMERTNDETIKDIKADYIYTGALNNDGGILELKDNNGNLIDKIDFSSGWEGGYNNPKVSMERDSDDSWKSNNLIIKNGTDANNNNMYATPRSQNSVSQESLIINSLPFAIFDEITFKTQTGKYVIRNNIDIPENKILTIDPGVVLNFYDQYSQLTINGTLKALGTENDKIEFRSNNANPIPGSWGGLYFKETSRDSELKNIILKNAGGNPNLARTGIYIKDTLVDISDSIIEGNIYAGIHIIDSNSVIDNVTFIDNIAHCVSCANQFGGSGILINGGSPVISNSLFDNNRYGAYITSNAKPLFKDNTFQNNETVIFLTDSSIDAENSSLLNNDLSGILVIGNIMEDAVWQSDMPYIIRGGLNVASNLEISAGSILQFYDKTSRLIISGTLNAQGKNNEEILFTALAANPIPGSWGKIEFSSTSKNSILDNVIVEYGGGLFNWGAIELNKSSVTINNSLIRFNKKSGVLINSATGVFNGVKFLDNKYGLFIIENGSAEVSNSSFNNHSTGIYIENGTIDLDNIIFGEGDEANNCNIYQNGCLNPTP